MRRLAPIALAVLVALGCGPTPAAQAPTLSTQPVDLPLRASNGRSIDLVEYRGHVVLLALLGSYDTNSQASLESLSRFARHHEDVFVVAILAQQGADLLADAYAAAANVQFPIAYCTDDTLLGGSSPLGVVEEIPTFISLDALGRPAARHQGFASERALESLADHAALAAPIERPENLPLLGGSH